MREVAVARGSGVVDLAVCRTQLLAAARRHPAGRSSRTVVAVGPLRITMVALAGGSALADHAGPAAAVLQVLDGTGVLHTDGQVWPLAADTVVPIPRERHGVRADDELVFLLTVAGEPAATKE